MLTVFVFGTYAGVSTVEANWLSVIIAIAFATWMVCNMPRESTEIGEIPVEDIEGRELVARLKEIADDVAAEKEALRQQKAEADVIEFDALAAIDSAEDVWADADAEVEVDAEAVEVVNLNIDFARIEKQAYEVSEFFNRDFGQRQHGPVGTKVVASRFSEWSQWVEFVTSLPTVESEAGQQLLLSKKGKPLSGIARQRRIDKLQREGKLAL